MDEVGIVKSMVLTYSTGAAFDAIAKKYARYPDRFEVWCGFDYTDADQPGWEQRAVAELVRCHANGAKGMSKAGILDHDQLVATLEHAVRDNPRTRFIACHLANCNSNLGKLGRLFDAYPNLYADVAARYGEFSPIPRFAKAFMEKYANRIVYGTDMGNEPSMYRITFRILESADEHFYEHERFSYHWPLHGLDLDKATLKKIYTDNARRIMK